MDIKEVEKIISPVSETKNSPSFTHEIVEHLLVLEENNKGWTKELNLISYNGKSPVYDLRQWSPMDSNGDRKQGKGITITPYCFEKLTKYIVDNKDKFKENN